MNLFAVAGMGLCALAASLVAIREAGDKPSGANAEHRVVQQNRSVHRSASEAEPLLAKKRERRELGQGSLDEALKRNRFKVTVGGYVRHPGPVYVPRGSSLRDALEQAGGVTAFGAMNRAGLIREVELTWHDLQSPQHEPVRLQANDMIEVPQKMIFGR